MFLAFVTKGRVSDQLGGSNIFGKFPENQTIEATTNKDTQTSGGTKGISPNVGQFHTITSQHITKSLVLESRQMVNSNMSESQHKDFQLSSIKMTKVM